MKIKKIIAGLMALTMCIGFIENPAFSENFNTVSVNAEEELTTGSCGENVTYSFDAETGVLTISGTGEMYDYSSDFWWGDWYSLLDIEFSPFKENEDIKKVIIEEGVENIGAYAFQNCTGLAEIILPDTIKKVGDSAFKGCVGLEEIMLPESIESIDDAAFAKCTALKEISIPDGVIEIGCGAFTDCINLAKATISDSVLMIFEYAFNNCPNLKEITLSANIEQIYEGAFGYFDNEENGEELKIDGFKIYGYTGTAAEEYAKENEFEFIALDGEENPPVASEKGDIDGDGEITSEDALNILQAVIGLTNLSDKQKSAADLDGDGEITSSDALAILQKVVGLA